MAYRQSSSVRSQVRKALLQLFSDGSIGTVDDVVQRIERRTSKSARCARKGVSANGVKVQIAQVRNELLDEVLPRREQVSGKITHDQRANLERRLLGKRAQAKVEALLSAA